MIDQSFLTWPFFEDHHRELARTLESWTERELATEHHGDEYAVSAQLVSKLGSAGWLSYCVPASHSGKFPKLDVRSLCLCRETLARTNGLADFAFAMQGLGAGPISLFGSESQKVAYLPAVARGEKIAAFALSEKAAGSDVAAIATRADEKSDHFLLNGEKTWISNAGIADFYIVFARTSDAGTLNTGAKGLSAFIVDANTPGFCVSEKIAVTSPHPLGTIQFKDCKLPKHSLLATPGDGFKVAMATLDVFRSTVGAAALGFARRALEEAVQHVKNRRLFGQLLKDFQLTQQKIADMATEIDASALLIYRAAWAKDSGSARITREAAMAKMFATESAQKVIDSAMQLLGGNGVVSDSILERLYRDIRPLRIYEGTTEIQKLIIATQLLSKD